MSIFFFGVGTSPTVIPNKVPVPPSSGPPNPTKPVSKNKPVVKTSTIMQVHPSRGHQATKNRGNKHGHVDTFTTFNPSTMLKQTSPGSPAPM